MEKKKALLCLAVTVCSASFAFAWPYGNSNSQGQFISADGRYIAFNSLASNFVSGDTNERDDVYRLDLNTDTIIRVSVANDGSQGNGFHRCVGISADGNKILFVAGSNNLVPGDTNGWPDIFVRDVTAQTTTRVNVSTGGVQANADSTFAAFSSDGTKVVFQSNANSLVAQDTQFRTSIYVRDLVQNTTELVCLTHLGGMANSHSHGCSISGDGNVVAFSSMATNLVTGDTNNRRDIFVRDLVSSITVRASVDSNGIQANQDSLFTVLNHSGTKVLFESMATNLVPGDTNGKQDVFLRDISNNTTTRLSVDSAGQQSNGDSTLPRITPDDAFVVFQSNASNLVANDTNQAADVFLREMVSGATSRVSLTAVGEQTDDESHSPVINASATRVAFSSRAANIVTGKPLYSLYDVYVRDLQLNTTFGPSGSSNVDEWRSY